jgi:hypothetical protein
VAIVFPEYVQLGAHKYAVKCPYLFKERSDLAGQCDNAELEIRISLIEPGGNPRPESEVLRTFFHEVLHAVDCIFLNSTILNMKECEKIINGLAEGLTQAFMADQLPRMDGE